MVWPLSSFTNSCLTFLPFIYSTQPHGFLTVLWTIYVHSILGPLHWPSFLHKKVLPSPYLSANSFIPLRSLLKCHPLIVLCLHHSSLNSNLCLYKKCFQFQNAAFIFQCFCNTYFVIFHVLYLSYSFFFSEPHQSLRFTRAEKWLFDNVSSAYNIWEFRFSRCRLLYIRWINNKILL